MSDIVERLRDTVQILATTQMNLSMKDWDKVSNAVLDAAGAIKRLRDDNGELTRRETEAAAEIERLRAALREIASHNDNPYFDAAARKITARTVAIARAALGETR